MGLRDTCVRMCPCPLNQLSAKDADMKEKKSVFTSAIKYTTTVAISSMGARKTSFRTRSRRKVQVWKDFHCLSSTLKCSSRSVSWCIDRQEGYWCIWWTYHCEFLLQCCTCYAVLVRRLLTSTTPAKKVNMFSGPFTTLYMKTSHIDKISLLFVLLILSVQNFLIPPHTILFSKMYTPRPCM